MYLRISTLGRVTVSLGEQVLPSILQQRMLCALLVYLAVERRVTREELARVFWPDSQPERARAVLRQNLYRLRQSLGREWVVGSGEVLQVVDEVRTDVAEFRAACERGSFGEAVELYGGPFLHDLSGPDAGEFERWTARWRAQVEGLNRRARRGLIDSHVEAGDLGAALAVARDWSDADPLEDEAQHRTVELLFLSGLRAEALAHFERYRGRLRDELQVEPLEETLALVERIRAEEPAPAASLKSPSEAGRRPLPELSAPAPAPPPPRGRLLRGMLAAALAALTLAADVAGWPRDPERPVAQVLAPGAAELDPASVAVLYFDDLRPGGGLTHVGDGIAEQLILELSQVPGVKVVSAGGAKRFRDANVPVDSVARALRVGSVVRGTVQASEGQLRVIFHLVDATGAVGVQSGWVQRPMGELFAVQDTVARAVVRFLRNRLGRRIQLQEQIEARPDLGAYLLVRQATTLRDSLLRVPGTPEPRVAPEVARLILLAADSLLARAEALDPDWSEPTVLRGWIARDRARLVGSDLPEPYAALLEQAVGHAERVLRRDPDHPEALELRGTVRMMRWRASTTRPDAPVLQARAEHDLRRAVELKPSLASAWITLSRVRLFAGAIDEADVFARRALSVDPFLLEGADIMQRLFSATLYAERFDEAGEWCGRGRAEYSADARFVECELALAAWNPHARVAPDSAARLLEKLRRMDPDQPGEEPSYQPLYRRMLYAMVLVRAGRPDRARDVERKVWPETVGRPDLALPLRLDAAYLSLMLGDTARTLELLEGYVAGNPQSREYVRKDFAFRGLQGDPRFEAIVAASRRASTPRSGSRPRRRTARTSGRGRGPPCPCRSRSSTTSGTPSWARTGPRTTESRTSRGRSCSRRARPRGPPR
ncbi:MAG TPA: BTAD domain-containing putative transcriptional regulator [Longimicrobiaceae bacterium]